MLNLQQQLQGHAHIVKLVCAASQLSEAHDRSANAFDEYLLLMELCSGKLINYIFMSDSNFLPCNVANTL